MSDVETTERAITPEMVILARESRGLTQSSLANQAGITQGHLSKLESGLIQPTVKMAETISEALDYPEAFFRLDDDIYGPSVSEFYHRKRASISNRILAKTHAQNNIRRIHVSRLLTSAEIDDTSIPRMDPDEYDGNVEEIARMVRSVWKLPKGPIKNLIGAIENAGGIVIPCKFENRLLDGMSQWIPGLPPLFFLNRDAPGDRQRLTLAHELGHLIMHRLPRINMEEEAFRFAGELLMPEEDIRAYLHDVSIPSLASLKPYWRVSIAAILRRARDLNEITDRRDRHLWMLLGREGYRQEEPAELAIPKEQPGLLAGLFEFHQRELGYSLSDLSKLLTIHVHELMRLYDLWPSANDNGSHLRAIQ